mmetsp:Transcript_4743/g.11475  ORF Transcript_4743/g.11475 Transcript_4743/m.11475 type:complete len:683 (+) Transcript_4743:71-2119(+)
MKLHWAYLCTFSLLALAQGQSPLQKVLSLLTNLESKILQETAEAKKAFEELTAWCKDGVRDLEYDIKTRKSELTELKACIESADAQIASGATKVEELAASISSNEADLKAATGIREKEATDFKAAEGELMEIVSTLERAIGLLEREMKKHSPVLVQLHQAASLADAFKVMLDAAMLGSKDVEKLTALVQSAQTNEDDSQDELGAPDPAVYKARSGNIIDTLEDLLEKAKGELDDARAKETANMHNFELMQQSITDENKYAQKDMQDSKKGVETSKSTKASCEGDLAMTTTTLKEDEQTMASLKTDCATREEDYESQTKSRAEELEVIRKATSILRENATAASSVTYGLNQVSFLQINGLSLRNGADLANFEAVRLIRDLARREHSEALMQLAMRISALVRGSDGQDPFAKVKTLISDMIGRLEKDQEAEATHKAYCDKELADTLANRMAMENEVDALTAAIDSKKAESIQLKQEVAELQKSLADLAASQTKMDAMRAEEHEVFVADKADLDTGLEGVREALKVLRDYYSSSEEASHTAATGTGTSVIGFIEVIESDISRNLAEMTVTEESAQHSYEKQTQLNKILKTQKEADVKYKSKEAGGLDKAVAEHSADLSNVQDELAAILDYKAKLQKMCIAAPETYEERTQRRQDEIAGLKEALSILEGEAALLQRRQRALRGLTK